MQECPIVFFMWQFKLLLTIINSSSYLISSQFFNGEEMGRVFWSQTLYLQSASSASSFALRISILEDKILHVSHLLHSMQHHRMRQESKHWPCGSFRKRSKSWSHFIGSSCQRKCALIYRRGKNSLSCSRHELHPSARNALIERSLWELFVPQTPRNPEPLFFLWYDCISIIVLTFSWKIDHWENRTLYVSLKNVTTPLWTLHFIWQEHTWHREKLLVIQLLASLLWSRCPYLLCRCQSGLND